MTERRRALTFPFSVNKDEPTENPLKITIPHLSSDCGKLETQVSWTAFAGFKLKHDSLHKNGSKLLEHKISIMGSRKPCVILKDVLKTKDGMDHLEKMKQRWKLENCRRKSRVQGVPVQTTEDPPGSKETGSNKKSEVRTPRNNSKSPKCNENTPSSPSLRSKVRKKLQNTEEEEEEEESKDIKEVIIGTTNGKDDKFAEVVDCGLSVSWKPSQNTEGCEEFSPAHIKDRLSDPEKDVQQSAKRKRKETQSQCNGTSSPKRPRESVLRLSGEDGRNRGTDSSQVSMEEGSGEYGDLESLDQSIVQFTVGAEDQTEVPHPVGAPYTKAGDIIINTSQVNATKTRTSEPIVLSSDDEESREVPQGSSPTVKAVVMVKNSIIKRQIPQTVAKQQEASEVVSVIVEDLPGPVSLIPSHDLPLMNVTFSSLYCGGYMGKSNGDFMITDEDIIIPLTDSTTKVEVMIKFKREELRRYSIWVYEELEAEGLYFNNEEDPFPSTFLLFCLSENGATAVWRDLVKLGVNPNKSTNTGKVSPFVLLTHEDPLEGIKQALLGSFLDMDCLKGVTAKIPKDPHGVDSFLSDKFHTPALSLDESLELINKTGLDSCMLSLLGLDSNDPGLSPDQDVPHCGTDENMAEPTHLEDSSPKKMETELKTETQSDTGTQLKAEEEQKDEAVTPSSENRTTAPVYTLCHRRTRGSYSVSLCRPDPSWTKYKHQGTARRLIQFPPPPLKGGITVTMEDLQCLDSGQFLNDVIIDFYLKYLIQNSSQALVERCHIFSSFFYKQLTRRDNASESTPNETCQRQRRHQRVKTWTRHIDIFKKDFLFVPVNQEAHWYLVVICFPGLEEPKYEVWKGSNLNNGSSNVVSGGLQEQEPACRSKSPNDNQGSPPAPSNSDAVDTGTEKAPDEPTKDPPPGPVDCTAQTCTKETICKRPCILIMDSLKLSLHERVFKLLREYLQSEWEVRRGSSWDFGPDQMQSSHCKVPLQDNSSDCGLYLLQYVESFLKDPVVHFNLPLQLTRWFPRQQVRRKRDEIRELILHLYRKQHFDSGR